MYLSMEISRFVCLSAENDNLYIPNIRKTIMGTIITFVCPDCGYDFDYFAGGGFISPKMSIEEGNHGERVKKLYSDLVATHGNESVFVRSVNGIYVCGKCGKFKIHNGVKICVKNEVVFDDSKVYCECKHRMKRNERRFPALVCPKCKSAMTSFESGLWD